MSRRIVIGPRSNGDTGIFVSPPGVDAFTAADSSLVLNVSSKVSQLILLGHISSSQVIQLGLGQQPFVFITQSSVSRIIGANGSNSAPFGPMRPSPVNVGASGASVTINSSGASMSISTPGPITYAVYSKTF